MRISDGSLEVWYKEQKVLILTSEAQGLMRKSRVESAQLKRAA